MVTDMDRQDEAGAVQNLPEKPGVEKKPGRTIHVVINPAAGQDSPILKVMNTIFSDAGYDYDVFITQEPGDAKRFAQEAVAAGVDIVATHGGDGTVIETASGLINSSVPLAIIPGGTANMTARALGIPNDLSEALTLIVQGQNNQHSMTLGKVNDRLFSQLVSIGMGAKVIEGADRDAKDRLGNLAYLVAGLQALGESNTSSYHIRLDDQEEEIVVDGVTCLVVIVENSGIPSLVDALECPPGAAHLDVIVLEKTNLGAFFDVIKTVAGLPPSTASVERWHVQKAHIWADPPQPIQSDGELLEQNEVTVEVLPNAVQVIVPVPVGDTQEDIET